MKDTLEEIMLYAVATLAVILSVALVAFICGTLLFVTLRMWGV